MAPCTIERCQQPGIVLAGGCDIEEVAILIGADWANMLQQRR